MLAKQYSDTGGTLTEDETKEVLVLMKKVAELESEFKLLSATEEKDSVRLKEVEQEIVLKRKLLVDLESSVQSIPTHS